MLKAMFPIADQDEGLIEAMYRGRPYLAAPRHYVDWQVLTIGSYELDDLKLFERLMVRMPQAVVLDVGTNVGHHAFFFATLGWTVHAFEPNPELWPIIEAKFRSAGPPSVTLHKIGLGDADETLHFSVPVASNSGTGQFHQAGSTDETMVRLPIRAGDGYLASSGVTKVDVVKLDVQGFEAKALRGLSTTLQTSRPILSVEIGDENRSTLKRLDMLAALLPPDYTFHHVAYHSGLMLRRSRLAPLSAEQFGRYNGNVLCLPIEKSDWVDQETGS